MKLKRFFAMLSVLLLLNGCSMPQPDEIPIVSPTTSPAISSSPAGTETVTETVPGTFLADPSELFSDRDYRTDYDTAAAAQITLEGASAVCSSNAVTILDGTVTIADEGTYILSGTLNDGMIIINADKQDKVQLVLNGVSITSMSSAPIYVLQADKVFITLAEGTENFLSNGGNFTAIDENNIDAVIFSKEDLTLNGSGKLTVTSPAGHGIVSKDSLTVTGGSYDIACASHGLSGKDDICIASAVLQISAGKDGIHAENEDDTELGFVYIEDGSFSITAEGDGISAASWMQLQGGSYDILTGGGSANAQQKTSENWGNMGGMGGGMMGPGGRPGGNNGGFPGGFPSGGTSSNTESAEDSASIKAVKAGGSLVINGGSFIVDSADDAIHSNGSVTVNAGSFTIQTGDDGFHADAALTVAGGSITVLESYEGLEGLSILISGGDIRLTASDDGLNAAGGTDQSGFGGFRGNDRFGSGGNSDSFITVTGGTVVIQASGDGIDSNGSLEIAGGSVTVSGPTQGDTAVLDYETTGVITGGTFIGTGSFMMAQTFSSSEQGVLAISVGNQAAGTLITLTDKDGNVIVSYAPELSFAIVILSAPQMVKGETYTITVGAASGSFAAA